VAVAVDAIWSVRTAVAVAKNAEGTGNGLPGTVVYVKLFAV
jgi:hypothetical protein